MSDHDIDYYSRRERQERERAERSQEPGARLIHAELAKQYSAMLQHYQQNSQASRA
jgi:hypothetical protein